MGCSISSVGGGKRELLSMNQSSLSGNTATFKLTSAQGAQLEAEAKNFTFFYFYVTNPYKYGSTPRWENFGAIVLADAFYDIVQEQKSGQYTSVNGTVISSFDANKNKVQIELTRQSTTGEVWITAEGAYHQANTSDGMTLKIYGIK